ncbi:hypothetical protein [Streptomyces sp. NPDC048445]|uniref:hypothetical protein n=1 Tax=Streptomyces sp. NPDC048445 TaxID=3365553 RepID=UPI00371ECF54
MDPLIEHACLATPTAYALTAEYGTYLVPTQYAQTYFLERLDDEDLWEDQPPKMRGAYRRFGEDLREGLRRPAEAEAKIAPRVSASTPRRRPRWTARVPRSSWQRRALP